MKFFVRFGETYIGVKIDRSGIELKDLSEIKAKIDADFAAKDTIIAELETEAENLKREIKIFHEIWDTSSAEQTSKGKNPVQEFDRDIAQAYMNKAVRDGRTEDDGYNDYLETLGIRRPETREAFLSKLHEWNCELGKRLKVNLDEFRMNTSKA
jgi:hypothetical protein